MVKKIKQMSFIYSLKTNSVL